MDAAAAPYHGARTCAPAPSAAVHVVSAVFADVYGAISFGDVFNVCRSRHGVTELMRTLGTLVHATLEAGGTVVVEQLVRDTCAVHTTDMRNQYIDGVGVRVVLIGVETEVLANAVLRVDDENDVADDDGDTIGSAPPRKRFCSSARKVVTLMGPPAGVSDMVAALASMTTTADRGSTDPVDAARVRMFANQVRGDGAGAFLAGIVLDEYMQRPEPFTRLNPMQAIARYRTPDGTYVVPADVFASGLAVCIPASQEHAWNEFARLVLPAYSDGNPHPHPFHGYEIQRAPFEEQVDFASRGTRQLNGIYRQRRASADVRVPDDMDALEREMIGMYERALELVHGDGGAPGIMQVDIELHGELKQMEEEYRNMPPLVQKVVDDVGVVMHQTLARLCASGSETELLLRVLTRTQRQTSTLVNRLMLVAVAIVAAVAAAVLPEAIQNVVLRGGPGGGKSVITAKIANAILRAATFTFGSVSEASLTTGEPLLTTPTYELVAHPMLYRVCVTAERPAETTDGAHTAHAGQSAAVLNTMRTEGKASRTTAHCDDNGRRRVRDTHSLGFHGSVAATNVASRTDPTADREITLTIPRVGTTREQNPRVINMVVRPPSYDGATRACDFAVRRSVTGPALQAKARTRLFGRDCIVADWPIICILHMLQADGSMRQTTQFYGLARTLQLCASVLRTTLQPNTWSPYQKRLIQTMTPVSLSAALQALMWTSDSGSAAALDAFVDELKTAHVKVQARPLAPVTVIANMRQYWQLQLTVRSADGILANMHNAQFGGDWAKEQFERLRVSHITTAVDGRETVYVIDAALMQRLSATEHRVLDAIAGNIDRLRLGTTSHRVGDQQFLLVTSPHEITDGVPPGSGGGANARRDDPMSHVAPGPPAPSRPSLAVEAGLDSTTWQRTIATLLLTAESFVLPFGSYTPGPHDTRVRPTVVMTSAPEGAVQLYINTTMLDQYRAARAARQAADDAQQQQRALDARFEKIPFMRVLETVYCGDLPLPSGRPCRAEYMAVPQTGPEYADVANSTKVMPGRIVDEQLGTNMHPVPPSVFDAWPRDVRIVGSVLDDYGFIASAMNESEFNVVAMQKLQADMLPSMRAASLCSRPRRPWTCHATTAAHIMPMDVLLLNIAMVVAVNAPAYAWAAQLPPVTELVVGLHTDPAYRNHLLAFSDRHFCWANNHNATLQAVACFHTAQRAPTNKQLSTAAIWSRVHAVFTGAFSKV